jgi:hypothetical protein
MRLDPRLARGFLARPPASRPAPQAASRRATIGAWNDNVEDGDQCFAATEAMVAALEADLFAYVAKKYGPDARVTKVFSTKALVWANAAKAPPASFGQDQRLFDDFENWKSGFEDVRDVWQNDRPVFYGGFVDRCRRYHDEAGAWHDKFLKLKVPVTAPKTEEGGGGIEGVTGLVKWVVLGGLALYAATLFRR